MIRDTEMIGPGSTFAYVKTSNIYDDFWRFDVLVPEINDPLPTGIIYAHRVDHSQPSKMCLELDFTLDHYKEVKQVNRGISYLLGLETKA